MSGSAIRAGLLAALVALGGCGQAPFDARAPWVPMQERSEASYQGGAVTTAPSFGFDVFDRDRPPPAEDVSVPSRASGENPWATPTRNVVVEVCYGRMVNTPEEVRAEAQRLCPAGSEVRLIGQDAFWNSCPLLQPARAAFQCKAKAQDGDGGAQSAPGQS